MALLHYLSASCNVFGLIEIASGGNGLRWCWFREICYAVAKVVGHTLVSRSTTKGLWTSDLGYRETWLLLGFTRSVPTCGLVCLAPPWGLAFLCGG